MKIPKVRVTVNSGEYEGKSGVVVGYDRDKYYEVLFDDGSRQAFKGHYLDGIKELKGHSRYLLQYTSLCNPNTLNNVDLAKDLRKHINKGRGLNKRFRYFNIDFHGDHGGDYYTNLNFQDLKRKVRHAMQNKLSFEVAITIEDKVRSCSHPLLEFDFKGNKIWTYRKSRNSLKYLNTFERGLIKEINKY